MQHTIKILKTEFMTYNTKSFLTTKPENFYFVPGQATDLTINIAEYKDKKSPFTFTSPPDSPYLEFIMKIYPEHERITKKLLDIKSGDEFIITDPFGTIQYKGRGIFIAGGAGITPFIAMLRNLKKQNKLEGNTLIFSNKTEKDIILKNEFDKMYELKKIYTLTREKNKSYESGRINESFLRKHIKNFKQNFYICGHVTFVGEITYILQKLGVNPDSIVVET